MDPFGTHNDRRRTIFPELSRVRDLGSSKGIERAISWSRREFLRAATGATAATVLSAFSPLRAMAMRKGQKAVVVTFGGGTRDEETFMPDGQENIPHLLGDFIPQGTFFTQVVNRGILGHYVATASLVTGVYETFNNFAAVSPDNPTVFEYFRKELHRPASDAWVVAPSNGFGLIGESSHSSHGAGLGAGVILPKRLLAAAMAANDSSGYEHLLRDNYESPVYAPALGVSDEQLHQMAQMLKVSVADFAAHARSLRSPDELSVYVARQLMHQLAPSLLWITLHDIDVAHSGTYSLYVDAITALRSALRRDLADDSKRTGIRREDDHVHPAGLRPRLGYHRRRQWLSTSPHRRRVFENHVDDGERRRHQGKRARRSSRGIDRPGSHAGIALRLFAGLLAMAKLCRRCCSHALPSKFMSSSSKATRPQAKTGRNQQYRVAAAASAGIPAAAPARGHRL